MHARDAVAVAAILSFAVLAFDRSAGGIITGFSLSSGTERGLAFEKQQ